MPDRVHRRRSRRRVGAVALAVSGVLAPLLGPCLLTGDASAAPAPAAARSEDPGAAPAGFPTGDAQASADTFTLAVKAANATIGFTFGRSIAQYQDRTGSAQARALDLGALPTLFGGVQCDGSPPLLPPESLPPLTRADSSTPGSEASRRVEVRQAGVAGGPPGDVVGHQDATATALPSSRAQTDTVPMDVFLVGLTGGRTEATTRRQGRVREAVAVTTADELRVAGGLFTFTRPRWEAVARSGDDTTTTGSFTFEAATVLGQPRSAQEAMGDLANFKAFLDALLAPFGVTFDLPTVQARDGGVAVTPMGFRIANPPVGTEVLTPFLGQVDPFVQALRTLLVEQDCRNQLLLTVADVLLGVLGGSGSVEILAGGVDATTTATDYTAPPLGAAPADVPAAVADLSSTADSFVDSSFADTGTSDFGALDDLGALPFGEVTLDEGTGLPASGVAAAARRRATVLPPTDLTSYEPSSSGRAAVAVGVAGLVGAVGLSMADRVMGRRARRRIP